MKKKGLKVSHTSNKKIGVGDYYGSGVKNKTGSMVSGVGYENVSPKKLKKPPLKLA